MKSAFDVVIIGAGAAGLFCAAQAAVRGLNTLVVDNGKKAGRKILMSGGGRCNFTNLYIEPAAYLSANPHFCKSALSRYTQWDFIALVAAHGIAYHEKTLGQLFCDDSAEQIVEMLLSDCDKAGAQIRLRTEVLSVARSDSGLFTLTTAQGEVQTHSLVVASGGLSMPGLGAGPLGYRIAEQFGLPVQPTRAGLVPVTLHKEMLQAQQSLAGIAVPVTVSTSCGPQFRENLLFTHRGLSGPAILQISSYW
ncbi:MAG: aminoacetone oxidase family FAD-binding enzyme, partial [Plesiomonas shigelloides]